MFLINRVPSFFLEGKIPYEVLHGHLPDLTELKVFGSLCYASTLSAHRSTFSPRSRKCIFLGYKSGTKGFIVYDLSSRETFVSRDVEFYELVFPFTGSESRSLDWKYIEVPSPLNTLQPICDPLLFPNHTSPNTTLPTPDPNITSQPSSNTSETSPPTPQSSTQIIPARKSERSRHKPAYLTDYYCSNLSSSTAHPIEKYLSYSNLSSTHRAYAFSLAAEQEPVIFQEASKHDCWIKAMNSELQALEANKTWILVDLPAGVKPIGSKWVYKIKRRADGSIERYKARLVAKGYNQVEGIDYFDFFPSGKANYSEVCSCPCLN